MSDHATGARRARRASEAAKMTSGFYVVNNHTRIVVAGPFPDERVARQEADYLVPPTMDVIEINREEN